MCNTQSAGGCNLGKIEVNLDAKMKILPLNRKTNLCHQGYNF